MICYGREIYLINDSLIAPHLPNDIGVVLLAAAADRQFHSGALSAQRSRHDARQRVRRSVRWRANTAVVQPSVQRLAAPVMQNSRPGRMACA